MAVWAAGHASVLCASVCVSRIHIQLCCWLDMQTGKQQPHPLAWDGDPHLSGHTGLGSSGQAGGTPVPGAGGGDSHL